MPFLSRWSSLGREFPFRHKVVYSVDNGRSLQHAEIDPPQVWKYHAILEYSGGKWPTISSLFNSLTANLLNWLSNSLRRESCEWKQMSFCIEKTLMCLVLKIYLFPVLHLLIKCLVTKLRTNRNIHQVLFCFICKFYWEMDRNENYWIKMPENI